VQAIKNIDFGKVVVWDSGSSEGSSTANFLSGLMKSVPPMQELFQSVGLKMPEFLGQKVELDEKTAANKEKTKTPGATEREK
jgi:flotillin